MTTTPGGPGPNEVAGESRTDVLGTVSELADTIRAQSTGGAKIRVAVVTAVQASEGRRVQTDQTGSAWIARLEDTAVYVGDRVALLNEGTLWLMIGRLTGEPGAVPIGAVVPFAGSVAPPGWLECAGQAISRTTYATLYGVVGNGYGAGDGSTTFNLPNLQGRVPVGAQGLTWFQTSTGGASTVTLSTAQMPTHTHGVSGNHDHTYLLRSFSGTSTGAQAVSALTSGAAEDTGGLGSHIHTAVGSSAAHENMPPYLVLMYIIRVL